MISLSLLFWLTLLTAAVAFWWHSDHVKTFAVSHTLKYCRERNLQLLDQTMVLQGLWPIRTIEGQFRFRRRYHFEFTSTGIVRNKGLIELIGIKVKAIELEAHILPADEEEM